jgi:hypothetical protein
MFFAVTLTTQSMYMQALLVAAAAVWAAAHRDAMLLALARVSLPDVATALLMAAAVLR